MSEPDPGTSGLDEVALVVTTLPDSEGAERLVRTLLEERLIACGNILPGVISIYRWEGEVTREGEVFVLLKSTVSTVDRLFSRVAELHPYSVPELIALPATKTAAPYWRWVVECLQE